MSFKKLIEPLKEALKNKGFETPLAFQSKILSKIKGGASMFAIAPTGSGKTTSLVLSVIQKLKGKAVGDAPRVIVVARDKQAILDLELEFESFLRGTDLRLFCVHDERNIEYHKEEIYVGTDIVIVTPKRLTKIYLESGINLSQLQLFIVEDADFLFRTNSFSEITRLSESIGRCQYLIFLEKFDKRFEDWQDTFMINSLVERG